MELFASACVLSRWDAELRAAGSNAMADGASHGAADLFLRGSLRRARRSLGEMRDNDDAAVTATANWILRQGGEIR